MNTGEEMGLQRINFDKNLFDDQLGERIIAAGHRNIAERLLELGMTRTFLARPLTDDERYTINDKETPLVAQKAAMFQDVVAKVPIEESGERMVDLRAIAHSKDLPWTFSDVPYHPACGDWAGKPRLFWVRETVGNALVGLTTILKDVDYSLHFEDAFRPLGVQEGLFARRYSMTAVDHPNWNHDQILLETKSKTAYTPRFASHKGGAAVDVRVIDDQTRLPLDIGHEYPDGGAIVALNSPFVTQSQWQNRYLLHTIAEINGLSAYPFEDWHYSLLDTTAAACNVSEAGVLPIAKFGPIKKFDTTTGEILASYEQTELDEVFKISQ